MKDIVDMKESGEIVSFGEQLGFDSIEFGLKGKVVTESDELKIRNKPYISKQESFNIVFIDLTKEII